MTHADNPQTNSPAEPADAAVASDPSVISGAVAPDDVAEFAGKLFELARAGDMVLLEYIQQGVRPTLSNHEGQSFLMLAAYHGHAQLVTALAEAGADPNQVNDRNQTPLAGAIFKKEEEVIAALLAAGADPYAGSPSALETAQVFGREDLVAHWRQDRP